MVIINSIEEMSGLSYVKSMELDLGDNSAEQTAFAKQYDRKSRFIPGDCPPTTTIIKEESL